MAVASVRGAIPMGSWEFLAFRTSVDRDPVGSDLFARRVFRARATEPRPSAPLFCTALEPVRSEDGSYSIALIDV